MKQSNTKEFAVEFCDMLKRLMEKYKYVGDWGWGAPGGQDVLPVYEIKTKDGNIIWCSLVEYCNSRTGEPNRRGILAGFP